MNKTIKNASLGAAIILAGTTGVANTAHASEQTTPDTAVKETFKPLRTPDKEMEQAEQNKTEAAADVAKTESELKQNTDAQKEASDRINSVKQDIEISKNAKEIVASNEAKKADVQKELTTATEQQNNTANAATQAKNAVTNAEKEASKAKHDVVDQEADVDSQEKIVKDMSTEGIAKSISDQENELKTAQEAVTENKTEITQAQKDVTRAENVVRDYKPQTRTTYVDPSLKEYVDNHPTNVADYKYNKDYRNPAMENVAFTGTKVVTTEITKEQYDQYRKTGKFDYVVDNQKLAESFVKLLNELRELNGVKGNIKADSEFMAYAEARANEMSKNNVLSHSTNIENKPGGAFENAYGSFGQTRIENGKTIISMYQPTTHDSFAYELLLGWYSDYTNATGANYGHRRALLTPVGQKFGIAITTKPGAEGNDFTALEMQTFEPEYEYEDGEKYAKTTPESEEFWKNYTGFNQDDKLNPTFNGKKMKFIAEHTFLFTVTEIVNDQTANLQAALDQAKAKRNALATKKSELENKVASSIAKLSDLKSKAQNIETALANAKAELATVQSELMVLKEDKDSKVQLLKNTQRNLDTAKTKFESASVRISEVQTQLNQVKDELAKAQELQLKLPELEKSLLKAEAIKDKAIETRKSIQEKLVQAQKQLTKVTVEYNRVKTLYDLEKTLNLYQGDKGTIAGIPNNSPEVPTLPEFDINTLAKPEQPTNPVTNNVSVKPLPTNNDKPTRVDSLASSAGNRETTNEQKTLPNTGSFSRVERQMALGGYTALGLSLGLLGFAMRRQRKH